MFLDGIIALELSLWHYRFDIIALKCSLKTHFLKFKVL